MKGNKGFTLIEMILVIAILAIMAAGAISGMNYIKYGNTKKCVALITSALDEVRIDTMSMAEKPYLYLYYYDSYYYYLESTDAALTVSGGGLKDNGIRIANSQVTIFYKPSGGAEKDLSAAGEDNYIRIAYSKSKGTFDKKLPFYEEITVKGITDYVIHMVLETGKHYLS